MSVPETRPIVIGCMLLLLTGCASAVAAMMGEPTPYRTDFELLGSWHGTRAEQTGEAEYTIKTSVNPNTDPSIMAEFNMLKSAELAQEEGYTYVVVLTPQKDLVRTFVEINRITGTRSVVGENYLSELEIRLANVADPDLPSFSAIEILAELGPKHLN
ncbi:MAG: hypothetical protein AAFY85_02310 [Pseudomonadota bacterium]